MADDLLRQWQQGWKPQNSLPSLSPGMLQGNPQASPGFGSLSNSFSSSPFSPPSGLARGGLQTGGFQAPTVFGGPTEVPVMVRAPFSGVDVSVNRPFGGMDLLGMDAMKAPALQPSVQQRSRSVSPVRMGTSPRMGAISLAGASTPQLSMKGQMSPGQLSPQTTFRQPYLQGRGTPLALPHVSVPPTLLERIDGVVSGIEKEFSGVAGDPSIDWLDNQICTIEQRREACETRQKHLAELRRIVSDSPDPGRMSGSNGQTPQVALDNGHKGQSFGRLSILEREHSEMKQQMSIVEQHQSDSLAARLQLETEAQTLQNRLLETELALSQERHLSTEAGQMQLSSEANLRTLESKSREVLEDCRELQRTVSRLENERSEIEVAAERRFQGLREELAESNSRLQIAMEALEHERAVVRSSADTMQREMSRKSVDGAALQKLQQDKYGLQEQLRQAVAQLEMSHTDVARTQPSPSSEDRIAHIMSLEAVNFTVKIRTAFAPDLLHRSESDHHFLQKVAQIDEKFKKDMEAARELHVQWVKVALQNMAQARSKGHSMKDYAFGIPELTMKRKDLNNRMASLQASLFQCQQELSSYSDNFSEEKRAKLAQYLAIELDRVDHELELLQVPSLSTLDEQMLEVLVRVEELSSRDNMKPLEAEKTEELEQNLVHWAAQQGKRDILEYLLSLKGANELINACDSHGRTPLYYASTRADNKLHQTLIDRGAERMHAQEHPLRPQIRGMPRPKQEALAAVENHGWNHIHFDGGYTLLHWAAYKGNADLCKYLMRLHGSPQAQALDGSTPIKIAVSCENQEAIQVLREALQNENGNRGPPQITHHHFKERKAPPGLPNAYKEVVDQIELRGWSEMEWKRNYTLLHWAAKNNRADLCKHFLYRSADPNQRDDAGKSALEYAKEFRSEAALRVLQSRDATPLSTAELQALLYSDRRGSVVHVPVERRDWNTQIGESF